MRPARLVSLEELHRQIFISLEKLRSIEAVATGIERLLLVWSSCIEAVATGIETLGGGGGAMYSGVYFVHLMLGRSGGMLPQENFEFETP